MSSPSYRCYSCGQRCEFDNLSAECMCFNKNDETAHYRGVCKECKDIPREKWVEKLGEGHSLNTLPQYTSEQKQQIDEYWADVEKNLGGGWSGASTENDKITYKRYERDEMTN